jgi:hypothetical protein
VRHDRQRDARLELEGATAGTARAGRAAASAAGDDFGHEHRGDGVLVTGDAPTAYVSRPKEDQTVAERDVAAAAALGDLLGKLAGSRGSG